MRDRSAIDALTKGLVDQGKLIEAGWQSLRLTAVAPDAPHCGNEMVAALDVAPPDAAAQPVERATACRA